MFFLYIFSKKETKDKVYESSMRIKKEQIKLNSNHYPGSEALRMLQKQNVTFSIVYKRNTMYLIQVKLPVPHLLNLMTHSNTIYKLLRFGKEDAYLFGLQPQFDHFTVVLLRPCIQNHSTDCGNCLLEFVDLVFDTPDERNLLNAKAVFVRTEN
ncbi:hypothetical protein ACB098_11G196300 [Castanea mollissima]